MHFRSGGVRPRVRQSQRHLLQQAAYYRRENEALRTRQTGTRCRLAARLGHDQDRPHARDRDGQVRAEPAADGVAQIDGPTHDCGGVPRGLFLGRRQQRAQRTGEDSHEGTRPDPDLRRRRRVGGGGQHRQRV